MSFIPGDCSPRQMFDDADGQMRKAAVYVEKMLSLPGDSLPVFWPDMGPVNMACLLMSTNDLLTAMYTDPELVHKLLRLCADVILSVLKTYRKQFGTNFVPVTWPLVWFPDGWGTCLTQDALPFLSPSLYREFELPLVKEIAAASGGVYLHCCGECEHVLDDLATPGNVRGFDHAYPHSRAPVILKKPGYSTVLTSGVSSRGQAEFPSQADYLRKLLPQLPGKARLWHVLPAQHPELVGRLLQVLGLPEVWQDYQCRWKKLQEKFNDQSSY